MKPYRKIEVDTRKFLLLEKPITDQYGDVRIIPGDQSGILPSVFDFSIKDLSLISVPKGKISPMELKYKSSKDGHILLDAHCALTFFYNKEFLEELELWLQKTRGGINSSNSLGIICFLGSLLGTIDNNDRYYICFKYDIYKPSSLPSLALVESNEKDLARHSDYALAFKNGFIKNLLLKS